MTDHAMPGGNPTRNFRTLAICLAVVAGMAGMAYAAVPLYALFCQVTGYGGTTQRAEANPKGLIARQMTVRFDSNVDSGLAWTVSPAQPVTEAIGKVQTITYTATNLSNKTVTGTAIFNVAPERAGMYFNKIECFCFTEQTLKPGERVEMPVTFFVDPALDQNQELETVREITLSYTFYASDTEGS